MTNENEEEVREAFKKASEMLAEARTAMAVIVGSDAEHTGCIVAGGDRQLLMAALIVSFLNKSEFHEQFLRLHHLLSDMVREYLSKVNDPRLMAIANSIMQAPTKEEADRRAIAGMQVLKLMNF